MQATPTYTDEELVNRLRGGAADALDALFRRHYVELCRVANRFVRDENQAEDIVQELFVALWEKRSTLPPLTATAPYLRRSTRNRSLNYLRDRKRIPVDDGELPETLAAETGPTGIENFELGARINGAIDRLPERCRLVFTMSKVEDMSHREIAQSLNISTKTVENQMTRAYRHLRAWLALLALFQVLI
ncbi:RNA polymerase sigma-70 factor [Neolewinella antarctica]|uniref:RNA polymerase sigma-70 factor (ECF subfamily) n=1 Tax=Neolewinella antarctica TaxID=442734 RepID=A0ABX0X6I8_9BACT|nr:RNA polymerase sigma-70 factor [Neolewinella antarctica]NJC24606.1 RNA polymerase sigma-70 factor (ECF subfamily) [Neolewinella antarctica]